MICNNKDLMTSPPLIPTPSHLLHTHKDTIARVRIPCFEFKTLNSEYLNINQHLNKCPNNVVKIYFIKKLPQRRIGTQELEHYGSMINFASNI